MYGLSDQEIGVIREGRVEGFAPAEANLLRMADAMADTPSNVSDDLYAELRRYFSEEQLIELAAMLRSKTFERATTVCSMWEAMDYIEKDCALKSGRRISVAH